MEGWEPYSENFTVSRYEDCVNRKDLDCIVKNGD